MQGLGSSVVSSKSEASVCWVCVSVVRAPSWVELEVGWAAVAGEGKEGSEGCYYECSA